MKRRSLQIAMRPLLAAAAGAAIALAGAWGLGVFESGWSDAGVTDAYAAGFAAGAEQGLADQAAMQAEEAAAAADGSSLCSDRRERKKGGPKRTPAPATAAAS